VADFHIAIVETIAEHYKIDSNEIIKIIQEHPRMKEISTHPVLESSRPFEHPAPSPAPPPPAKTVKFIKKLKKPAQV
jgi:hypothetical protein